MLKGLQSLRSNLDAVKRSIHGSSIKALQAEASSILEDSRSNYVPIDQGTLRDDSRVTEVVEENGALSVSIVYGENGARDYALAVHENPSEHDPISWQGGPVNFKIGGAKYLELPLNAAEHGLAERIASRIKLK
jgi:hypothetical protein